MNTVRAITWTLACGVSVGLTWAAHRGPPLRIHSPTPEALGRPATATEWAAVQATAMHLSRQIRAANARAGRSLGVNELEGHDAQGQPWLPSGLPDNPVVVGVGSTRSDCSKLLIPDTDWIYCQSSGALRPGGIPAEAPL